ncbi:phage antirepressor KilAC domain-containing protein [Salipaludibacillus agaradhaerens]|jgi:Rha family phage regulatory protein|uniref:phage antirepressor KilAC domain-containing protein n=1 Tax=Salipaludibacillus agaradhaerens TaxID=76935 RepID=UPI0009976984|nr:phage antirepressor KilAC domain-containing protein [Salipaludibacillus agaradhaerens]
MNQLQVFEHNGKLVADSRDVAEMTGKEHSHLLRDINNYNQILGKSNFGLSDFFIESYYSSGTRNYKHYLLTKKGCDMVANKMTGQKGVLFTAAYVTKFEEMEREINQPYKLPKNYKEALLQLVEKEEENEKLSIENQKMKPYAEYAKKILSNPGLVSVSSIAKDYGMTAQQLNKKLHELGVQYKRGEQWFLYRKHDGKGYVHSHTFEYKHRDGTRDVNPTTKWTQKGRLFIYSLLKDNDILPEIEKHDVYQVV